MGKKSRMKREAAAIKAASPPELLVVANRPRTDAEVLQEAIDYEAACMKVERLNNTPLGHPENLEKMHKTFAPIEEWVDHFDKTGGEYDVTHHGLAIIRPEIETDEYFPIHEAFHAICDTYELIANDRGIENESTPLRIFANKIHYDSPVMEREIRAVRDSLSWMKRITATMTPIEFSDYSVAIQIKATMRELKAA